MNKEFLAKASLARCPFGWKSKLIYTVGPGTAAEQLEDVIDLVVTLLLDYGCGSEPCESRWTLAGSVVAVWWGSGGMGVSHAKIVCWVSF